MTRIIISLLTKKEGVVHIPTEIPALEEAFDHEDFFMEFNLPEALSITQYESISGEELKSLSADVCRMY